MRPRGRGTGLALALERVPFLTEFGHPCEPVGKVEQILPDLEILGLARQASERIRDPAVMLGSRLGVTAGHAGPALAIAIRFSNIDHGRPFRVTI